MSSSRLDVLKYERAGMRPVRRFDNWVTAV